jgi:hypothetical protein
VAQGGVEHRAQVLLVVDEQQTFTGHAASVAVVPGSCR